MVGRTHLQDSGMGMGTLPVLPAQDAADGDAASMYRVQDATAIALPLDAALPLPRRVFMRSRGTAMLSNRSARARGDSGKERLLWCEGAAALILLCWGKPTTVMEGEACVSIFALQQLFDVTGVPTNLFCVEDRQLNAAFDVLARPYSGFSGLIWR